MTLHEMRQRWRGLVRRRLMGLRGRIDRRIERLDEKRQSLHDMDAKVAKGKSEPAIGESSAPVTGPASPTSEAKRPSHRRPSRRRGPSV